MSRDIIFVIIIILLTAICVADLFVVGRMRKQRDRLLKQAIAMNQHTVCLEEAAALLEQELEHLRPRIASPRKIPKPRSPMD